MALITESENPFTKDIDQMETIEALRLINDEDKGVAAVVTGVLDDIASVVEAVVRSLSEEGRLFYIGTGTSGRLGVLDAAELPPTFGVSPKLVTGVIAGGDEALSKSVEAVEDDRNAGAEDLLSRGLLGTDVVIGIAASGTTPYTVGAVEFARSLGCFTSCITSNPDSEIANAVEIPIVAVVGPEAITGSTRMKSGTAQKMILNMISTVTMIKLGYVKGNKMINVKAANKKLVERSLHLLAGETGLPEADAEALFEAAGKDLKTALVMHASGVDSERAAAALEAGNMSVASAIRHLGKKDARSAE